jgi:hypothetical protein
VTARKASDVAAKIADVAKKTFDGFLLAWRPETMSWRCASPRTGFQAFKIYTAPHVVFMWGDIGSYVFNHSDRDSLGWLTMCGAEDERYPDYFLGKLVAMDGQAIREFCVGDAEAYIDERISEDATNAQTADGEDDIGEAIETVMGAAARTKRWLDLREKFREYLGEQVNEERACWQRAWYVMGETDPPDCMGWTVGALWAWHAARTFARLHATRLIPTPTHEVTP